MIVRRSCACRLYSCRSCHFWPPIVRFRICTATRPCIRHFGIGHAWASPRTIRIPLCDARASWPSRNTALAASPIHTPAKRPLKRLPDSLRKRTAVPPLYPPADGVQSRGNAADCLITALKKQAETSKTSKLPITNDITTKITLFLGSPQRVHKHSLSLFLWICFSDAPA